MSGSAFVRTVNALAVSLINAPVIGGVVRRGLIVIRYQGRRSGNTFEIPVGDRRRPGGSVVINVAAPEGKSWWRNFLGSGGPITLLDFDGADRTGHAVAHRDERGRVSVSVNFD
ncbi:hypothetical protein A5636_18155 [Mycobacterium asiaticum]|uniref:Nitroreductase n=2 Tax=Mycobacterium asiaticum TaxID=1790 RepID=A0A1A3NE30_MYCAS|nr:hypothetical protein A5636_18155 [Mycobacterium asiaticum]